MTRNWSIRQLDQKTLLERLKSVQFPSFGKVLGVQGNTVEACLIGAELGSTVRIESDSGSVLAEVIGFKKDRIILMPYGSLKGVSQSSRVVLIQQDESVRCGRHLLGRVVNAFGEAIDGGEPILKNLGTKIDLHSETTNPMERSEIKAIFETGIKAVDTMLTLGKGQRVAIVAGSGVGKSVLMGMFARNANAHVNIIGLIGERGREVKDFIHRDLGKEGLEKSIVVATTSDDSPLQKIRAAHLVHAYAEFFAAKGQDVCIMLDSMSRVAYAQREIGLAAGEPPTTKGYTPSCFSLLPKILERSGPQKIGSISAFYTVLAEGDDIHDPVVDTVRSIVDGQIVLSRDLAAKAFFPAIDLGLSISRLMHQIVPEDMYSLSQRVRNLLTLYKEQYDLVQIGAYRSGSNPEFDIALRLVPQIEKFLRQDFNQFKSFQDSLLELKKIIADRQESPGEGVGDDHAG